MRTRKPAELKSLLAQRAVTLLDLRREADRGAANTEIPGAPV